jgi:hypothetical protein
MSVMADSYSGPAVLIREDGQRLDVTVALRTTQEMVRAGTERIAGLRSWAGRITSPGGWDLFEWVGGATIELPSGATGIVIVTSNSGTVQGSGAPPY